MDILWIRSTTAHHLQSGGEGSAVRINNTSVVEADASDIEVTYFFLNVLTSFNRTIFFFYVLNYVYPLTPGPITMGCREVTRMVKMIKPVTTVTIKPTFRNNDNRKHKTKHIVPIISKEKKCAGTSKRTIMKKYDRNKKKAKKEAENSNEKILHDDLLIIKEKVTIMKTNI